MKTYTDTELKQLLAKMLLEKLEYDNHTCPPVDLWHKHTSAPVLNTELLHLAWMVEESLMHEQWQFYVEELPHKIVGNTGAIHATWQQRVTALAKVKGIV